MAKEKNDAGIEAYSQGEIDKAMRYLEEAVHLSPNSVAYRKNIIPVYAELGKRVEEATMHMQIGELSKSAPDLESAAEIFLEIGDSDNALECLRKASTVDPKNDHWHTVRSNLHKKRGEYAEAVQCLRTAFDRLNAQRADNKSSTVERAQNINDIDARFYTTATELATLLADLGETKASNDVWRKAASRLIADWNDNRVTGSNTIARPCNVVSILLPIVTHHAANLLASEEWYDAFELLNQAQLKVPTADYPMSLTISSFVAKIRTGRLEEVRAMIRQLLTKRNVKGAKLSFFALSDALISLVDSAPSNVVAAQYIEDALSVLLHVQSEYNTEDTWMRLARCYERKEGSGELALEFWRQCFEASPENPEFAIGLQNACRRYNRASEGLEVADLHKQALAAAAASGANSSASLSLSPSKRLNAASQASSSQLAAARASTTQNASALTNLAANASMIGMSMVMPDLKNPVDYSEVERELELAFGHASLLWMNRKHAQHIEALTAIFQRNEVLFYRRRRRRHVKPTGDDADFDHLDRANPSRKSRGKNKIPADGYSSGITAIKTRKKKSTEDGDEGPVPLEEDYTFDDGEEEDEEEILRAGEPGTDAYLNTDGSKKRKRGRPRKSPLPPDMDAESNDPLAEAEHVTFTAEGWEAVLNKVRLKEMRERKNLWEIPGIEAFTQHLLLFCQSLLIECAHDGVVGSGGHYFWDENHSLIHIRHKPLVLDDRHLMDVSYDDTDTLDYNTGMFCNEILF